MNDNQTRTYNSGVTGQTVMNNHSTIWNGKQAIVLKKSALDDVLEAIEDSQDDQEIDFSGNTTAKKNAKRKGANDSLVLAKVLRVFAADINDAVLHDEIDFGFSDLLFVKDATAKDRWQLIHDRADTHTAALVAGGYGVTALMVTDQQASIDAFTLVQGAPEAARAETKAATADIKNEIGELREIKRDLIDLHAQFASSEPTYYNAVLDGFEIIDTGVRHQALRVVYFDDTTSVRLPDVKATLVENDLHKKSSDVGVVTMMQQETGNGNYTLISEREGYTTVTNTNLGLEEGKLLKLEIRLVKV